MVSRAVVALMVTLGLGVFDLGPRASAWLWLTLGPPARAATTPGSHEPLLSQLDFSESDHGPPANDPHRIVPRISQGLQGSSGCTSSPSAPSGTGAGSPALSTEATAGV